MCTRRQYGYEVVLLELTSLDSDLPDRIFADILTELIARKGLYFHEALTGALIGLDGPEVW